MARDIPRSAPVSSCAWSTPFLTTDQERVGSLAVGDHDDPEVVLRHRAAGAEPDRDGRRGGNLCDGFHGAAFLLAGVSGLSLGGVGQEYWF